MGFSAVASVIAGTAEAATVAAAVGEVGLAMTVVGAVTGSKDLMKIGGVMGLAGGVGSLAFGAGDAATAGVGLTGDAVPETGAMTQAGDYGMNATADNAGSAVASSVSDPTTGLAQSSLPDLSNPDDAIDMASNAGYPSLGGSNPYNVDPLGTGQPTTSGANAAGTSASGAPSTNMSAPATTTGVTPDASASAGNGSINNASQDRAFLNSNVGYGDIAPTPSQGFFSNIMAWAQKNPQLANGAAKLGAGALQGMGAAYDANRKYQLGVDQLALQQQQAKNANSLPTINNMGIISGARG